MFIRAWRFYLILLPSFSALRFFIFNPGMFSLTWVKYPILLQFPPSWLSMFVCYIQLFLLLQLALRTDHSISTVPQPLGFCHLNLAKIRVTDQMENSFSSPCAGPDPADVCNPQR